MRRLALKVDADTLRGTLDGVPRLAALLDRLRLRATFLFSLGPDHTGRALRRVFRRGFLSKVRRTSVVSHYGLRTLLYGTLLPGPHVGREGRAVLRQVAAQGYEVGVHAYDHVKWQDGVVRADLDWTRREFVRACEEFDAVFGRPPRVCGAAGWQVNAYVPELERNLGFRYASDTRGHGPFLPAAATAGIPQLPTTLPTLDELIGRPDLPGRDPVAALLAATRASSADTHVYTLHAEIEGGQFLEPFERLISGWLEQGWQIGGLAELFDSLEPSQLPSCPIVTGSVAGRSGTLACQGIKQ